MTAPTKIIVHSVLFEDAEKRFLDRTNAALSHLPDRPAPGYGALVEQALDEARALTSLKCDIDTALQSGNFGGAVHLTGLPGAQFYRFRRAPFEAFLAVGKDAFFALWFRRVEDLDDNSRRTILAAFADLKPLDV